MNSTTLPPEAFICPLTQMIMVDPVENAMGVTFEQSAILAWIDSGKKYCPVTGIAMTAKTLTYNTALQWKIRYWKQCQQQQQQQKTETASAAGVVASKDNHQHDDDDEEEEEKHEEEMKHHHATPPPLQYVCPLTKKLIQHAVMTRQGYNFERSAIYQWLALNPVCPLSGQPMSLNDVVANAKLQWQIENWQKEQQQQLEETLPSTTRSSSRQVLVCTTTVPLKTQSEQDQALLQDNTTTTRTETIITNADKLSSSSSRCQSNNSKYRPNVTKYLDMSRIMGRPMLYNTHHHGRASSSGDAPDTLDILDQVDEALEKLRISSSFSKKVTSVASLVQ